MWIKLTDNAGKVWWVNGSHVRRLREVRGVDSRWTEIHFDQAQFMHVQERVEDIIGRLT